MKKITVIKKGKKKFNIKKVLILYIYDGNKGESYGIINPQGIKQFTNCKKINLI